MRLNQSRFEKHREKFIINKNKANNKNTSKKDLLDRYKKKEGKKDSTK